MPQYSVNEPLKHDSQSYGPGETVEMDAKAAKELLALGVLGATTKAKAEPKAKADSKPAEPDATGADDGTGDSGTGQEEGK